MTIQEIRDRFFAVLNRHQEDLEALLAEIARGLSITVCGQDVTAVIAQEKAEACEILRIRFEHFDNLACG